MTYDIVVTASARRDLQRVPPRVVPAIVEFMFGDLADAPHRVGRALKRELEGLNGARRGPYRILYRIDGAAGKVYVMRIDHRSDVYRTE